MLCYSNISDHKMPMSVIEKLQLQERLVNIKYVLECKVRVKQNIATSDKVKKSILYKPQPQSFLLFLSVICID